mmetsp:Transcript_1701/g.3799  ORF Transcript_1701/g.3799 Transcript_1701/m.3799 type:complete len:259 (+) Transcript_1701:377-1153(+)
MSTCATQECPSKHTSGNKSTQWKRSGPTLWQHTTKGREGTRGYKTGVYSDNKWYKVPFFPWIYTRRCTTIRTPSLKSRDAVSETCSQTLGPNPRSNRSVRYQDTIICPAQAHLNFYERNLEYFHDTARKCPPDHPNLSKVLDLCGTTIDDMLLVTWRPRAEPLSVLASEAHEHNWATLLCEYEAGLVGTGTQMRQQRPAPHVQSDPPTDSHLTNAQRKGVWTEAPSGDETLTLRLAHNLVGFEPRPSNPDLDILPTHA